MSFKRTRAASPSSSQKRPRGGAGQTITLGTELPPDEDADDGSFVPLWKQTVTDERGRRRLHGAFTGGFSAGYFNTVGSKEGWAPKTFVSSRSNRNDAKQTAEDFMDEEDLAAVAESRQLETAQSLATIGRAGDAPKDAFFGLFQTEEETMGVKIAQKMGWRREQGVGRKVRRLAHLEGESSAPADTPSAHMFAPQDARTMSTAREEVNRRGLGYQSEARLGMADAKEDEERPMLALPFLEKAKPSAPKKAAPKKSSFGVGVLNDTGSDDEDPYELGPKITFNKTLGKDKKAKKPSKFAKPGTGDKLVFVSKKTSKGNAAPTRRSFDGRPPLRGFVLAVRVVDLTSKRRYPPPRIPHEWTPAKSSAPATSSEGFQSVTDAAKTSTLDAKARASLLGETPLPGRSVFDFISKEARDRLASLTGNTKLPQGLGQTAPEGQQPSTHQPKDLWSFVPVLDKGVAAAALAKGATGWMPYAEDMQKRRRYVGFLELRAGTRPDLPERDEGVSISEWAKELGEFAHAAQVFKPTTGIMASRFTSSTSFVQAGSGSDTADASLLRKPVAKPEDPADQAATLGMYGPMTRSSFPFHPSRLLCKRFNVKPPPDIPPGSASESGAYSSRGKTEEAVSKSAMDQMLHEVLTNGVPSLQRPAWMNGVPQDAGSAPLGVSTPEHATVDVERNEALTRDAR